MHHSQKLEAQPATNKFHCGVGTSSPPLKFRSQMVLFGQYNHRVDRYNK
ncbi:hypothetical protein QUB63_30505 [Microcoleus sp. ARI1-B5]